DLLAVAGALLRPVARPLRIDAGARLPALLVAAAVPVEHPLPRVADHVVEPVHAGRLAAHVPRPTDLGLAELLLQSAAATRRVLDERALARPRLVAPAVELPLGAARRLLPLRLRGKILAVRVAVLARLEPAHALDRHLRMIEVRVPRPAARTLLLL